MHPAVVIVGLGEVGKPLLDIMKSRYQTFGVDINQPASISQCDVMHICFPFAERQVCWTGSGIYTPLPARPDNSQ